MAIEKFLSPFITSQLPRIYSEEGPLFVAFIKAYFEWMENAGQAIGSNPIYDARRLLEYRDIDETLPQFLTFFKNKYMSGVPALTGLDDEGRLAQKHIKELYASKGNTQGLKLLFRLLYNTDVDVYLPGNDILRPSDGTWRVPQYLEVSANPLNVLLVGEEITGRESGAKAIVEGFNTRYINRRQINVLTLSNVRGVFRTGELALAPTNIISDPVRNPRILGSLSSIRVNESGFGWKVGDVVDVVGGSGIGGKAVVSAVSPRDGAVVFTIVEGGSGYSVDYTEVDVQKSNPLQPGTGANFRVGEISNREVFTLALDEISGYAATPLDAPDYGFPSGPADINTPLNVALDVQDVEAGTIRTLIGINPGEGYRAAVVVNVVDPIIAGLEVLDPLRGNTIKGTNANITGRAGFGVGAVDSLMVMDAGFGYSNGDTLTLEASYNSNTLSGVALVERQGVGAGYWVDTKSFLSADKYIQDSFYYQEYSYEVRSSLAFTYYSDLLKRLWHPAGMERFGRAVLLDEEFADEDDGSFTEEFQFDLARETVYATFYETTGSTTTTYQTGVATTRATSTAYSTQFITGVDTTRATQTAYNTVFDTAVNTTTAFDTTRTTAYATAFLTAASRSTSADTAVDQLTTYNTTFDTTRGTTRNTTTSRNTSFETSGLTNTLYNTVFNTTFDTSRATGTSRGTSRGTTASTSTSFVTTYATAFNTAFLTSTSYDTNQSTSRSTSTVFNTAFDTTFVTNFDTTTSYNTTYVTATTFDTTYETGVTRSTETAYATVTQYLTSVGAETSRITNFLTNATTDIGGGELGITQRGTFRTTTYITAGSDQLTSRETETTRNTTTVVGSEYLTTYTTQYPTNFSENDPTITTRVTSRLTSGDTQFFTTVSTSRNTDETRGTSRATGTSRTTSRGTSASTSRSTTTAFLTAFQTSGTTETVALTSRDTGRNTSRSTTTAFSTAYNTLFDTTTTFGTSRSTSRETSVSTLTAYDTTASTSFLTSTAYLTQYQTTGATSRTTSVLASTTYDTAFQLETSRDTSRTTAFQTNRVTATAAPTQRATLRDTVTTYVTGSLASRETSQSTSTMYNSFYDTARSTDTTFDTSMDTTSLTKFVSGV